MHIFVASTPQPRSIAASLTIASLLVIAGATLLPADGVAPPPSLCLICGERGGVDAILNVLLFMPLGAGLAWLGWRARGAITAMALLSLAIELSQFLLIAGRDASLGDLLTNSIGGAAGYLLARHAALLLAPRPCVATRLLLVGAALWLALQGGIGYALTPRITPGIYHVQIARAFDGVERFRGVVRSSTLGGGALRDGRVSDNRLVLSRLTDGRSMLGATLSMGPETRGVSPIVRIVDTARREMALLAQRRLDLVFAVRTGATALRLRPLAFAIALDSDPDGRRAGDVSIAARQDAHGAVVILRGSRDERHVFVPDVGMAWSLVLPFQWYMRGSLLESLLGALWLALTLFPLGYWSACASTDAPLAPRLGLIVGVAAIGLVLGLLLYGMHASPVASWAGALVGVASGVCIGRAIVRRAPSRDRADARAST